MADRRMSSVGTTDDQHPAERSRGRLPALTRERLLCWEENISEILGAEGQVHVALPLRWAAPSRWSSSEQRFVEPSTPATGEQVSTRVMVLEDSGDE